MKQNKMELTQQQRDFIVKGIVYDINDSQASDHYDFNDLEIDFDDLEITWVPSQESYLVERNGEKHWADQKAIISYIEDLSNEQLIYIFMDNMECDEDDWEEYLEDEMAEQETA